jgi:hypothetical protein
MITLLEMLHLNNEEIRDVVGFEGNYSITESGKLYSHKKKRYVSTCNKTCGYLFRDLYKDGKRRKFLIHRLVAQAFVPNPENKPEVNHKDGHKLNNHYTNLEWVTKSENHKHACWELGHGRFGGKASKPVVQKTLDGEVLATYPSIKEASRSTGLWSVSIGAVANGKQRKTGGYVFEFTNTLVFSAA